MFSISRSKRFFYCGMTAWRNVDCYLLRCFHSWITFIMLEMISRLHFYNDPWGGGNFGRYFIFSSLSYNAEYWVWNGNATLRILTQNTILHTSRLYLSAVPPTRRIQHKSFLKWVRAQGHSPHALTFCKSTSGSVGIPLKRGASGPRKLT